MKHLKKIITVCIFLFIQSLVFAQKEYIYTCDSFAFDYCFTGEASNFKDIFSCRRFKGKYKDTRKVIATLRND